MFQIDDSDFDALENYFHFSMVPVLNAYFARLSQLAEQKGASRIFFISREGEFLSRAFRAFAAGRGIMLEAKTLHASRSLLLKLNMPDIALEYLGSKSYSGTVRDFLTSKFTLELEDEDEIKIGRVLFNSNLNLPADAVRARKVVNVYHARNREKLANSKAAYLQYLEGEGFFDGVPIIGDVGYSATLQKLLAALTGQSTIGYYMIGTDELGADFSGQNNEFDALFANQGNFSEGNPLLDNTMVFEALMSASYGQCEDIHLDGQGKYAFQFGPKGKSQYLFPILDHGQRLVYRRLAETTDVPIDYLLSEHNLKWTHVVLSATLANVAVAPKLVQAVSEVDDRISGMGFLKPWKFFSQIGKM